MFGKVIGLLAAVRILAVGTPVARGQICPQPSEVYFAELSVSGNGSPAGTVLWNIAPDFAKAMTVLYDCFSLQKVSGIDETYTKTSTTMVELHMPGWDHHWGVVEGWSFTPYDNVTWGHADIEGDVTGTITTTAAMETSEGGWGESYPISSIILDGPFEGDYHTRGSYPIVQWLVPWETVGTTFRIDTTIELSGAGQGYLSVDSIDGDLGPTEFVPEPGSLAMLAGIALTALLYWWRKRA
jgi:hypothetical protein